MVLVVPKFLVAQCPMEHAVLLTLEGEQWDVALGIDMAHWDDAPQFVVPKVQKIWIPFYLK